MKNKIFLLVLILNIVSFFFFGFTNYNSQKEINNYVPDEVTAKKIAEAIWCPIYGEKQIEAQKPFKVELKDNIWIVNGTMINNSEGGVAYIEIQKSDCKILKVTHGK